MDFAPEIQELAKFQITATAGGISAQKAYTNTANVKTIITGIDLTNTDTVSQNVSVSIVPNLAGAKGTEAVTDRVADTLAIYAKGKLTAHGGQYVLDKANDTVQVFASKTDTINMVIMGVRVGL